MLNYYFLETGNEQKYTDFMKNHNYGSILTLCILLCNYIVLHLHLRNDHEISAPELQVNI